MENPQQISKQPRRGWYPVIADVYLNERGLPFSLPVSFPADRDDGKAFQRIRANLARVWPGVHVVLVVEYP